MHTAEHRDLSRRERQILDILYQRGHATAADVQAALPEPPSYSAVRALLRILEDKGHVRHLADGPRYVYEPIAARAAQRQSALKHLVHTFFAGSTEEAVLALLQASDTRLSRKQLDDLVRRIADARR